MNILAIESSCDETAVAVVRDGRTVLADCIASQVDLHTIYGGVVPELASRKHIEAISALADQALLRADLSKSDLDAVAVTYAPGLIGALLVGVSFAKSVAYALHLPLIPVHHVRGHIAANYIAHPDLEPPFVCLCVSGGTSLIVDVRGYTDMNILGATHDDAAGECFDKIARVLGLGYPGGAPLDRLSKTGDPNRYPLPRTQIQDAPLDMSFSGLKTATLNLIHNLKQKEEPLNLPDLAASFSTAVSEMLVPRSMMAATQLGYQNVAVVGGVAANSRIRHDLETACLQANRKLFLPPLSLCGDNGAMIGSQAFYEFQAGARGGTDLNAYANRDISWNPYLSGSTSCM
ncbi:MAG: tRNA (adenosine(37)-N6)-threonylcarbamoyltransferase complex transferase subunit TsaD [Evtepia sp.]